MNGFVSLLIGSIGLISGPPQGQADIDAFCELVPEHYVYFEPRRAYWDEACAAAREALAAGDASHLAILETLVDALYDPHANLGANNDSSPRLVPSGLDIRLAQTSDGKVRIVGIRPGTFAAETGIALGDEVVSLHGLPPLEAARTRIRAGSEKLPGRMDWALNAAMAGGRDQPRSITVLRSDLQLVTKLQSPVPSASDEPVMSQWLGDQIGYIRLENSLGDDRTVPAFLAALDEFRGANGLVLDLRNTPSGGNTNVAEPILGAFLQERMAYQLTVAPDDDPSPRYAGPAGGEPFGPPVVVLAGYWTGSMGEGLAIGFDATGAGHVMGSRMARLAGGTQGYELPESGIMLWLPTYDLWHMDGTPRHEWLPSPEQPADFGAGDDELLEEAIDYLTR